MPTIVRDQWVSQYAGQIGCEIESLAGEIEIVLRNGGVKNFEVICRVKDPMTLRKKMVLKNTNDVFEISDVYGIRVLVKSEEEAYIALKCIEQHFTGYLAHDYIAEPKTRADKPGKELRLMQYIAYRNSVPFEVQITTKQYNETNEILHVEYHREKYGLW